MKNTAVLLINCPDRKGLVAAIADFLYVAQRQHPARRPTPGCRQGLFLMRVEWDLEGFDLDLAEFPRHFAPVAERNHMRWRLELSARRPRLAIFVSRYDHCLVDLLYRHRSGELNCEIPLVIGNHPEPRRVVEFYGIPFHHMPVTKDNKAEAEKRQLELLEAHGIDLVVLARYMQVLSAGFVERYPERIINVHHSFLPAFSGARPYHAGLRARGEADRRHQPFRHGQSWTTAPSSSRT